MQPRPHGIKFPTSPVGSTKSPVLKPSPVIKNWGEAAPTLKIDGVAVPRGERFRFGHVATLKRTDLVCWIKLKAMSPVILDLLPDDRHREKEINVANSAQCFLTRIGNTHDRPPMARPVTHPPR